MEFSSDSISNIAPALLKTQQSLGPIGKDSSNPFTNSRYASLASVLESCRQSFRDNGILLIQRGVASSPGTVTVETRLIHAPSGEWIMGLTTIPVPEEEGRMNSSQKIGACLSYGRRYGLMSLLGMAAVDDDTDAEFRVSAQTAQHPASHDSRFASYLPEISDVTYSEVLDEKSGRTLVFASGRTMSHKDELRSCGFRWSPERRVWWREHATH